VKAAPFAYVRPATVDDTLAELSSEDAKVLAGGQSLVPVLAMRLARPRTLVDISAARGLDTVEEPDGMLRVGATVRQRTVERHAAAAAVPLLGKALPWVGHRELRSRGTVCGSLAHADPAAELPAVATCLGATVEIAGPLGTRTVPARELFTGAMTTVVSADELLVSVSFPKTRPGEGFGFAEVARRHGDFALAGVVVRVDTGDDSRPRRLRADLTCFGVSDTPAFRDVSVELQAALNEIGGDDASQKHLRSALADATDTIAAEVVQTTGDEHGTAGYRRRVVSALAARELARAHLRARHSSDSREAD
jgi:2-furoyl-CoA dehydrogenase FAD binding subunit